MSKSITETLVQRKVQMSVISGTNDSGNAIVVSRTYNRINPTATKEQMHATATAIGSLMEHSIANIYYDDKKMLEEIDA